MTEHMHELTSHPMHWTHCGQYQEGLISCAGVTGSVGITQHVHRKPGGWGQITYNYYSIILHTRHVHMYMYMYKNQEPKGSGRMKVSSTGLFAWTFTCTCTCTFPTLAQRVTQCTPTALGCTSGEGLALGQGRQAPPPSLH